MNIQDDHDEEFNRLWLQTEINQGIKNEQTAKLIKEHDRLNGKSSNWIGIQPNTSLFYKTFIAKDETTFCLQNKVPNRENGFTVSCDNQYVINNELSDKTSKIFTYFSSTDLQVKMYDICVCLEKGRKDQRTFYEVMEKHHRRKPYLDIDMNEHLDKADEMILNVLDAIQSEMSIKVENYKHKDHTLVFQSHSESKKSFHIIIDHYCFENNIQAKSFFNAVRSKIKKDYHMYLDSSVYNNNGNFRMYKSHKLNTMRTKELTDQYNTYIPSSQKEIWLASLITNTSYCEILKNYDQKIVESTSSTEFDNDEWDQIETLFNLYPDKGLKMTKGRNRVTRIAQSYCPIHKREHDNKGNGGYFSITKYGDIYFNCYASEMSGIKLGSIKLSTLIITKESVAPDVIIQNHNLFLGTYKPEVKETMEEPVLTDDIKLLIELYSLKDEGLVKIYYNKYKNDLYCVDQKNSEFYLFNDETHLWDPKHLNDIQLHFMQKMKILVIPLWKYYDELSLVRKNNNPKHEVIDTAYIKFNPAYYIAQKSKSLLPLIKSLFYSNFFLPKLNNNPYHLPVKDGVINLETGVYRERTHNDYFSFELNVIWKGLDFPTPFINNFMFDIMSDNTEMVKYLQTLLGYSITGFTDLELFVLFCGVGGNGKGILQNALRNLMGPYYRQLTCENVVAGKPSHGVASPHVMQLMGCRIGILDELEELAEIGEGIMKAHSTTSAITGRWLHGNPITFIPTHQTIVNTNYKPKVKVIPATKRRLKMVEFKQIYKNSTDDDFDPTIHKIRDNNMNDKFKNHLDEFLVWLVIGSIRYFKDKQIIEPLELINSTQSYLNDNDEFSTFYQKYKKSEKFTSSQEILDHYNALYDPINTKTLSGFLKARGHEPVRGTINSVRLRGYFLEII